MPETRRNFVFGDWFAGWKGIAPFEGTVCWPIKYAPGDATIFDGFERNREVRTTRRGGYLIENVADIKQEIVDTFKKFVKERMELERSLRSLLHLISNLSTDLSNMHLRGLHGLLVPDFPWMNLDRLIESLKPLVSALARAVAATPHSCDVERLILFTR